MDKILGIIDKNNSKMEKEDFKELLILINEDCNEENCFELFKILKTGKTVEIE